MNKTLFRVILVRNSLLRLENYRSMGTSAYVIKPGLLTGIALLLFCFPACMKDRPEALPEKLEWNPQLAFPLGEEVFGMNSQSGFDTLLLELDTITGQPIWTSHQWVVMEGTFDFDLSSISDNLDKLNRILFRLNFSNQFPHSMFSQAYFLDQGGILLDSMFRDGPVETPAALIGDQENMIEAGEAQHDALIEGDRLPALLDAQSILLRSGFLVASLDTLQIPAYPSYQFRVDAGLMLDLSFED